MAESSVERVASIIALFFSCSCTIRLSILSSITSLIASTGRRCPRRWIRSMASEQKKGCECVNSASGREDARYSTAGFHQLSMRYTRDASVKFKATPPAFKLTKKTVTSTLFTAVTSVGIRQKQLKKSGLLKCLIVASLACGLIVPSNRHTLKPAFCSLNAMRSRKLTNWLNTMLFVVASFNRRLLSSSTRASILDEDLQVSRLSLPRIPCRGAVAFSSISNAGASRSMVSGRWQTGQSGCYKNGRR